MALPILGDLIQAGLKIIDKVIPDPQAKTAAQLEFLKLQQAGEFKELDSAVALAKQQNDINLAEAQSSNWFVAGWRPAMGWCCVSIFAANFIGVPFLSWISPLLDIPPPPRLEIGEVLPVLLGMLGLGGMRMNEKIKGAAK